MMRYDMQIIIKSVVKRYIYIFPSLLFSMYYSEDLLVEKYRPRTFDDYIVHNDIFRNIIDIIKREPFKLNNMIFESPSPGTGKSTFAMIIQNELHGDDNTDCIYVNGSGEGGIDTIRTKITEFVKTAPEIKGKPKLVIFEEADGLTTQAQNSLKVVFEKYLNNSRIIFTTNNIGKINAALKSRSMVVHFSEPAREDIFKRLKFIVDKEGFTLDDDRINDIVSSFYPDIREMVRSLDEYVSFGIISFEMNRKIAVGIWKELKSTNNGKALYEIITDRDINHRAVIKILFDMAMKDSRLTTENKAKLSIMFLDFDMGLVFGAQPEICFVANINKISEFFKTM